MNRRSWILAALPLLSAVSLGAQASPTSSRDAKIETAGVTAKGETRSYRNPRFGWSVMVPAGWTVDTLDLAYVKINPPAGGPHGFVGIQAGDVNLPSLDSLVNMLLALQGRSATGVRVLARKTATLRDGTPSVVLDTELGAGVVGRSHRVLTLVGTRTVILDAETYRDAWPRYEADFLAIARSLEHFRADRVEQR